MEKKEFKMTQEEMNDIIAINKNKSPVMKFGNYWSGLDLAKRIDDYWKKLGDKYGFDWKTVTGPGGDGPLSFFANEKVLTTPPPTK